MQYKGASLDLGKKTKQQVELEKGRVLMLIHNNKIIASFILRIQDSYARLYDSLDFLVNSHWIPSVGSLWEAKPRN